MALIAPAPIGFERSAVPGATLEDLDLDALAAYLRQRAPNLAASLGAEQLATRVGLLVAVSGGPQPSIAGLMSFGTLPQLHRPEWGLSAVRIAGKSLADPITARGDLEGDLRALLGQALAFVRAHTRAVPDLLRPGELRLEYPEEAVREALTNALVHRDLRLSGRIGLRIFDDRLEISSPGGLPAPLPLDELAQHGSLSLPRNPLLAAVARGLGLIEQIGRGLPLIRAAVAEVSAQPVSFAASGIELRVTLPSPLAALHHHRGGGN
ncbi:MAG: hypothetical protein IPK80_32560 [Nannocystis sp.]|nr:hypothetical protein [Nannocystis sp.]